MKGDFCSTFTWAKTHPYHNFSASTEFERNFAPLNLTSVTAESITLSCCIFFPLPLFLPTHYLHSGAVCIWGRKGRRWEKSHQYQVRNFLTRDILGIGNPIVFQLLWTTQKSQMQSNFNCSVSFKNLTVCHSVKLLKFLHFRCFQFRENLKMLAFPCLL